MSASVAVVVLCAALAMLLLSGLLGGFWLGVEFRAWWEQRRRRHPITAEDSNGRRLLEIARELRQGAYLPHSPWPRAQLLDMATELRAIAEEHERIVETLTLDQRERADVAGPVHLGVMNFGSNPVAPVGDKPPAPPNPPPARDLSGCVLPLQYYDQIKCPPLRLSTGEDHGRG